MAIETIQEAFQPSGKAVPQGFDIGTLHLWFALAMLMAGGLMAMLIRAELFQPWGGAAGLEWTVPSPAPHHRFEKPPKVV